MHFRVTLTLLCFSAFLRDNVSIIIKRFFINLQVPGNNHISGHLPGSWLVARMADLKISFRKYLTADEQSYLME